MARRSAAAPRRIGPSADLRIMACVDSCLDVHRIEDEVPTPACSPAATDAIMSRFAETRTLQTNIHRGLVASDR
jgi:hypothetical protein